MMFRSAVSSCRQRIYNWMYGENSRQASLPYHYLGLSYDPGAPSRDFLPGLRTPDAGRVWGVDISGKWDGIVDLAVTKAQGGSFVIIKGMDGSVPTRYFYENRGRAMDAGLLTGMYAWLYRDANVSCVAQARAVSDLQSRYPVDLPVVVDFEWTRWMGQVSNPNYSDLDKWVSEFLRLGNRKPILYSAAGFMNQYGRMPDGLRAKLAGIWIANYDVITPSLPAGWLGWDFWQFTSSGDAGVYAPGDLGKKELDMDYWSGTLAGLYAFAGVPMETGDGGTMAQIIQGTAIGSVTRRKAPAGDPFTPARYLNKGDRIEADKRDATFPQWLHLTKINDAPVVGDEWASAGANQQYIQWSWVTVEDPPDPTPANIPDYLTAHFSDGTSKKYVPES
jgi:GH25 family lysozyme M1 (1,4-beta-N-acetylmuramidase)